MWVSYQSHIYFYSQIVQKTPFSVTFYLYLFYATVPESYHASNVYFPQGCPSKEFCEKKLFTEIYGWVALLLWNVMLLHQCQGYLRWARVCIWLSPFKDKAEGGGEDFMCVAFVGEAEAGIHRFQLSSSPLLPIVADSHTERGTSRLFFKGPVAHTQTNTLATQQDFKLHSLHFRRGIFASVSTCFSFCRILLWSFAVLPALKPALSSACRVDAETWIMGWWEVRLRLPLLLLAFHAVPYWITISLVSYLSFTFQLQCFHCIGGSDPTPLFNWVWQYIPNQSPYT